jgi:hypothetical protein
MTISAYYNLVIHFFDANPLLNAVSLFLGLFGILLGVFLYLRSLRLRLPIYDVKNINLIQEKVEKIKDIQITYLGNRIDNLSIARIAIWNRGRETINKSDVAPIDPIRLELRNSKILNIEIIYEKNPANNFSLIPVSIDGKTHIHNRFAINFDYFDLNEGIILQVFHTGKTDEDIKILGTIKGSKNIEKLEEPFFSWVSRGPGDFIRSLKYKHRKIILGILLIFSPLMFIFYSFIPSPSHENIVISKFIPAFIVSVLYWSMAFSVLSRRVPKGFELFEEKIRL